MIELTSCGILLFKNDWKSFLLMKHKDRWDLPKGHTEKGETIKQCAIREFEEETGLKQKDIIIIPEYRFDLVYYPLVKKYPKRMVKRIFMFILLYSKKTKKLYLLNMSLSNGLSGMLHIIFRKRPSILC